MPQSISLESSTSRRVLSYEKAVRTTEHKHYNRYAYVLNHPLALTDPSGYMSWGNTLKTRVLVKNHQPRCT